MKKLILIPIVFLLVIQLVLGAGLSIITAIDPNNLVLSLSEELLSQFTTPLSAITQLQGYLDPAGMITSRIDSIVMNQIMNLVPPEAMLVLNTWNQVNGYVERGARVLETNEKTELKIDDTTGLISEGSLEFGSEKEEIGNLLFEGWKPKDVVVKNLIVKREKEKITFTFKTDGYLNIVKLEEDNEGNIKKYPREYFKLDVGSFIIFNNEANIIDGLLLYQGLRIKLNGNVQILSNIGTIIGDDFEINGIKFIGSEDKEAYVTYRDGGFVLDPGTVAYKGGVKITVPITQDTVGGRVFLTTSNLETARKYENFVFLGDNALEANYCKCRSGSENGLIINLDSDNNLVPVTEEGIQYELNEGIFNLAENKLVALYGTDLIETNGNRIVHYTREDKIIIVKQGLTNTNIDYKIIKGDKTYLSNRVCSGDDCNIIISSNSISNKVDFVYLKIDSLFFPYKENEQIDLLSYKMTKQIENYIINKMPNIKLLDRPYRYIGEVKAFSSGIDVYNFNKFKVDFTIIDIMSGRIVYKNQIPKFASPSGEERLYESHLIKLTNRLDNSFLVVNEPTMQFEVRSFDKNKDENYEGAYYDIIQAIIPDNKLSILIREKDRIKFNKERIKIPAKRPKYNTLLEFSETSKDQYGFVVYTITLTVIDNSINSEIFKKSIRRAYPYDILTLSGSTLEETKIQLYNALNL